MKHPFRRGEKNDVRLYNVLFPFWMLLLFPQVWLIVLPGNFLIDSAVLLLGLFLLKITDKKLWYKKHILPIFLFGLLADGIGSAYMLLMMLGFELGRMGDEPYLTVPALCISAALIFVFNYFFTFRRAGASVRLRLSLLFAAATAPYTFLIPSSLLY